MTLEIQPEELRMPPHVCHRDLAHHRMMPLVAEQLVRERAELARSVAHHLLRGEAEAEQPPVERCCAAGAVNG